MANLWTREQLLVAFRLYCMTPFGKLHYRNPDIIQLSRMIPRSPGAIAMKASNFASLDPEESARGIKGLPNASKADRGLWQEFRQNPDQIAAEAESIFETLEHAESSHEVPLGTIPTDQPSEMIQSVKVRRLQSFFRSAVLISYDGRCAITGLPVKELLNASHIIPWRMNTGRRADPHNGILLNALFDRAFDRGFITLDEDLRIVVSTDFKNRTSDDLQMSGLVNIEGRSIRKPSRFTPDPEALQYHRDNVFLD